MEKGLSKQLRETVRKLERNLGLLQESKMSCCNISLAQCHALVEIGRAGSMSLNQLADLLNLENSTVSRTVNNLVQEGLVERITDQNDRRYVTIRLLHKGEELFNTIEKSMDAFFENVMNKISQDKKEQVLESMQILLDAIKDNNCC